MTDLGPVDPKSINAGGAIVGQDSAGYAFLFQDGTLTNLGALPESYRSLATAINDLGQIVGSSSALTDTVTHAVLWQNGAIKDLGTLPGYTHSEALGLNTNGQIAGSCYNYPGSTRASLFTIDMSGNVRSRVSLGTLPGFTNSIAIGINNKGQVVGDCWNENDDPPGRSFLWDSSHGMRDLNSIVSELTIGSAYAINDVGQIVASIGLLSPVLPARLSLPLREINGQLRFTLEGQAGRSYTIQASTNLVNWIALTNFTSATGTNQFTDTTASNFNRRFYRAVTP